MLRPKWQTERNHRMFKLDRKLAPDEFIQAFFEANRQDHQRPPHPWEAIFREGKATKEQLHGWGKERYYFTKQVPIKEYSILYNCPHTDVRRMWLPKAIEEEGEDLIGKAGKPHPEYWLDVCEGLGLSCDSSGALSRFSASSSPSIISPTPRSKARGSLASPYPKETIRQKPWRGT